MSAKAIVRRSRRTSELTSEACRQEQPYLSAQRRGEERPPAPLMVAKLWRGSTGRGEEGV